MKVLLALFVLLASPALAEDAVAPPPQPRAPIVLPRPVVPDATAGPEVTVGRCIESRDAKGARISNSGCGPKEGKSK